MKFAIVFIILLSCLFAIESAIHHKKCNQNNNKKKEIHQREKKSEKEKQEYLSEHNKVRLHHRLQPFAWDNKLEDYAKKYARKRYSDCKLEHSHGPYGENLFMGSAGGKWKPGDAVKGWANEVHYYNANDNSCQPGQMCGHYTQIVWRDTRRVGCARSICKNGNTFIVCEYEPPGNFIGQKPFDQHH